MSQKREIFLSVDVETSARIKICDSVMGAGLSGASYLTASAARANTSGSPASKVKACMDSRGSCASSKPSGT